MWPVRKVLRIYLQAGLDEGTIPSREIQDLVEALTDEKRLMRLLDDLDEQRFEAVLERLEDFERDFPVEAAPIAVPVLVNRMERLRGCLKRGHIIPIHRSEGI